MERAAEEDFARAEEARKDGLLEEAARRFGRAARGFRAAGDVYRSADAFLELGAVLLRQGRGRLLPELSARMEALLLVRPLPVGARLRLRVLARILARGGFEPDAYFALVLERRLGRRREAAPEGSGQLPE